MPKDNMMQDYRDFIARKKDVREMRGFDPVDMPTSLFGHQSHMVRFACQSGSAACFYDTGLGKTAIELAYVDQVRRHTGKPVMVLAPLAVGHQTVKEAQRFGIDGAVYAREMPEGTAPIVVTNYEMLKQFDVSRFGGVVLDESSILKSFNGTTSRAIIGAWRGHDFRLAATATPSPNDHSELGTHSAFVGAMSRDEMLMRWFLHDSANTGDWRLKGHAVVPFWRWVASWSQAASRPSDVGDFSDDGYDLEPFEMHRHIVASDRTIDSGDMLFRIPDMSATSLHKEKRLTVDDRADVIADLVRTDNGEPWIVWCDTDYEADALIARIPGALEVRGSQSPEIKEKRLLAFSDGSARVLITKPRIAGFGLNWQHCARVAFVGLSFSYEAFYQAVRRCWRFGQSRRVQVHVAMADTEMQLWSTISAKRDAHGEMARRMVESMKSASQSETIKKAYADRSMPIPAFI